ncbi:MAG: TRAP transporter large permease [Syntrophales bacterium]|jgi:tripartite ATP-independent transporter DctM subunit|nr:TRAP transporter large permease [Syntrophales bacterium]
MDPMVIGVVGIVVLMVLVSIGIHVGVALGVVGIGGMACIMGFSNAVTLSVNSMYFNNANYAFVTLPLFILMGLWGASGGISKTLYDGLIVWTGKIRGSLGIATVLGCAAFGAVCGSSIVTAAVFAKVSSPEMRRLGYDKKIAYGITASAGMIGMLIPPSILAVIYGILTGLSVGKLLLGGIGPGLLLTILMCADIYYIARFRTDLIAPQEMREYSWAEKLKTLPTFWPVIVTAIIIFGGIFGGVFSPTEASAVATVVILILLLVTLKKESGPHLVSGIKETATTSAMIFLTMAGACVFSRYLVVTGISDKIVEVIIGAQLHNYALLAILALLYLALGCLMDSTSMLTITIPILHPIIVKLGIDPYFFGVFMIYASQLGIITPPFGLAVFTVKGVAEPDVTVEDVFAGSIKYLFMMIAGIPIMMFFPQIITIFTSWGG